MSMKYNQRDELSNLLIIKPKFFHYGYIDAKYERLNKTIIKSILPKELILSIQEIKLITFSL
jgi:hypothetical protein